MRIDILFRRVHKTARIIQRPRMNRLESAHFEKFSVNNIRLWARHIRMPATPPKSALLRTKHRPTTTRLKIPTTLSAPRRHHNTINGSEPSQLAIMKPTQSTARRHVETVKSSTKPSHTNDSPSSQFTSGFFKHAFIHRVRLFPNTPRKHIQPLNQRRSGPGFLTRGDTPPPGVVCGCGHACRRCHAWPSTVLGCLPFATRTISTARPACRHGRVPRRKEIEETRDTSGACPPADGWPMGMVVI